MIAESQTPQTSSSSDRCRHGTASSRPSELSPLSTKSLDQHPWVFVPRDLVRLAGDANAGLLLARINYGLGRDGHDESVNRPRVTVTIDGRHWLAKTRARFARKTGLSESQVRLALEKLQEKRLVERLGRTELLRPTHPEVPKGCRGIDVLAGLVRMAGNGAGGLILSQLHYWTADDRNGQTRLRMYRDGRWWLAKQYQDFAEETGLTPRQVRSAVDRLRGQGVIQTSTYRFDGLRTLHLRFDDAGFERVWEEQELSWLEQQADRR